MGIASQIRRQAILQRSRAVPGLRRSFRSAAAGRFAPPPTRRAPVQRPGGRRAFHRPPRISARYRGMARGGFFKDIFRGVKKVVTTVTKLPVIGAVAKAAVGSLPVVGQVVTAVNAFKAKTPAAAAPPTPRTGEAPGGGVRADQIANARIERAMRGGRAFRMPRKRKKAKRARGKRAKAKRAGGTAKQRAARARFARAAKKGRIRKGQRL